MTVMKGGPSHGRDGVGKRWIRAEAVVNGPRNDHNDMQTIVLCVAHAYVQNYHF